LRDTRAGFGIQASWPTQIPPLGIPLDHCLVSPELVVLDRRLGPAVGSDHRPVILELARAGKTRE
jgi:endonuclease/exonuclease/phosphatase (EEP) superfamily protein YafD